jgi:hypothetical protein
MQRLTRLSFLSGAFSSVLFLSSCGGGLTAAQQALVDDSTDDGNESDDVQLGLEDALSGALASAPDALDPIGDALARVKNNAPTFFKPASCLTTTINNMTATHVFVGCTGPFGLVSFDGTVTSTWSTSGGELSVTHHTEGFKINGMVVNHDATIAYSKSGTTYTRMRSGTTSGTTGGGKSFSRTFDHTVTWDPTAACITREGHVDATLDGRSWSGTISDYKRCGIGQLGCPSSGTITLERTTPAVSLSVEFPGGKKMIVKLPNGKTVERTLFCNVIEG